MFAIFKYVDELDMLVMLFDSDHKMYVLCQRRGWPETANTWEPFDNLVSCSDIIDAFEERFFFYPHLLLEFMVK